MRYRRKTEAAKFQPTCKTFKNPWQALIMIGFVVAAFFIPSDPFVSVWYVFGLIAGMIFILVQLILYIDFAFNTNEKWVENMEDASDERLVYNFYEK